MTYTEIDGYNDIKWRYSENGIEYKNNKDGDWELITKSCVYPVQMLKNDENNYYCKIVHKGIDETEKAFCDSYVYSTVEFNSWQKIKNWARKTKHPIFEDCHKWSNLVNYFDACMSNLEKKTECVMVNRNLDLAKCNELRRHYLLRDDWEIIAIGRKSCGCVPFIQRIHGDHQKLYGLNYVVEYAGSGKYFKTMKETLDYIRERKFNFDKHMGFLWEIYQSEKWGM